MSSSRSPDFDKSSASFNSTLNDGYTTADESVTRYYSTFEVTDSTIEADNSEIIDSPCTMDEKPEIVQITIIRHDDNAECVTNSNENVNLNAPETKLTTSMHEENVDKTKVNIDPMENIKPDESLVNVVNNMAQVNDVKVDENTLEPAEQDKTITDVKSDDIVLGNASDKVCETAEGNVLLYKIEVLAKEVATPVDSEQCYDSIQNNKGQLNPKDEQVKLENKSEVIKETENAENYVEEYLDEEYLEYETVEGEPVTGDSNPNDTIMTPSDSDDDASDNSPVMAYLEKNENLNFYKNNPHATGLPKRSPEKSKRNLQNQISPITNGLTSVLLKSSDMPVIRYKKIVTGTSAYSEPKYAIIKETTLHSGIPRAKKLSFGSITSNKVTSVVEIDSKNESVPTVKKPRERKQVLEPANVDVVFELEKVKKEEEEAAIRKSRKKPMKNTKPGSGNKDVYIPSKVKRKWLKGKKETTKEETPTTPQRQSTRLKKSKNKKCPIASCKCDLDHEVEPSDVESEAGSNEYENTSDYSDEWQLSPKSISLSSQTKVKVYSNLRKRQHSHKSTFDDDEDDLSNDLLTLIKEDEKSNKEIDLNKEFPDKSAIVTSPLKKTKLGSPEPEELIVKDEEKILDSLSSIIHDDSSLFSTSMTLVKSEDEKEFKGFEPLANIIPNRKSAPLNAFVSIFNLPESEEVKVDEIEEIEQREPTTSANTNSVKKTKFTANFTREKANICSICNKNFPLKVHLVVHEKTHKVTSTCRFCSETFTYPTALKEHVKKNCPKIKEEEKECYLEELNKKKIVPAITRSKGVPLRLNTPRRMKLVRKTPLKSKVKPTSIPKGGLKSKLTKTPLKGIVVSKPLNTSKQINNLDKQNVRVIRKPAVQRYSTMKRRSQNVLQEINKTNNNVDEPATSSQTTVESMLKCNECKLDFKTTIALQRHKSTHKNTLFKCSKCNTEFRNQMLLSKHVSSCKQSSNERSTRRTMHVATLNQILSPSKKNKEKSIPLRKVRAHSGVSLSSKMQKVFEKIKRGDIKNINNAT